jgi:hypothetical protein
MINKIELGEGCYGPFIRINNVQIDDNYELKKSIIDELLLNIDKLDMGDYVNITKILVEKCNYSFNNEQSTSDICEQCGNYNYSEIYEKNDDKSR